MPPFYKLPLADLVSRTGVIAASLRTLPPDQLESELAALKGAASPADIATASMVALYEAESARRTSPEHRFDDDLYAALSRLERQTTPEDRQRVREIGEHLHRTGGRAALSSAARRMLAGCKDRSAELREHILQQRWAGLLG